MKSVHGKIKGASQYRGWITGAFYPKDLLNYDKNLEIKVEYFAESTSAPAHFHKQRKSWVIVLEGGIKMKIEDKLVVVKKGEYLIFKPKVKEELVSVDVGTVLVSVHAPSSGKSDKVLTN